MTLEKALVILVDGLPYYRMNAENMPFLASLERKGPLTPGFGFSINIYPELFAGRQPDALGYFNKWRLLARDELQPGYQLASALGRAADLSRRSQFVSRGLHKVWEKVTRQGNLANVPFAYLPFFAHNPDKDVFVTRDYPTFFNQWEPVVLLSSDYPGKPGEKDSQVVRDALAAIPQGRNLFILMGDLDTLAHTRGAGEPFDRYLTEIDRHLETVVQTFRQKHGSGAHVVVLSDHGMVEVDPAGAVRLDLERRFGQAGCDRYMPFVDALMLRLWSDDGGLLREMVAYLDALGVGHVLTPEERAHYGVGTPAFGEVLFLLDEKRAFFPSWFGAKFPLAMHGYDPSLESQQALFAYLGPNAGTLPRRALDVYPFLSTLRGHGT